MMSDGSIRIDTRLQTNQAKADLRLLKVEAQDFQKQINAIDTKIKTTGLDELAAKLDAAKEAAATTGDAYQEVALKLDGARESAVADVDAIYGALAQTKPEAYAQMVNQALDIVERSNTELMQQEETLRAKYEAEQNAVASLSQQYNAQESSVAALTAEKAGLTEQYAAASAQIDAETLRVAQLGVQEQAEAAAEQARIDAEDEANAEAEAQAEEEAEAQTRVADMTERVSAAFQRFGRNLSTIGQLGGKAFSALSNKMQEFIQRINIGGRFAEVFDRRVRRIAYSALLFTALGSALRNTVSYLNSAAQQSTELSTAMANLKGAAATAAQPILAVLTPALTTLANMLANVLEGFARLMAGLTGKSIASYRNSAKAIEAVGTAAKSTAKNTKDAANSVMSFDEVNKLSTKSDSSSSSDGSVATSAQPDIDFNGGSFLDTVLAQIQAGDWGQVGALIAEKINAGLANINWPAIQTALNTGAANLATGLNGFVAALDWSLVGTTIGSAISTAIETVNTFIQTADWQSLGNGIGQGLNNALNSIDWTAVGQFLTDGLKTAFGMLHGFLQSFGPGDFQQLGQDIATMLDAAIANVDWAQALVDVASLVTGLLTAINTALENTDWDSFTQQLGQGLSEIDWGSLIQQIGQTIQDLMPVLLPVFLIAGAMSVLQQVGQNIQKSLITWIASLFTDIIGPKIGESVTTSLLPKLGSLLTDTIIPALGAGATRIGTFLTTTLIPGIGSVLSSIGLFLASPLGIALLIAAAVIVLAVLLAKNWDKISAWFASTWDKITKWFNDLWAHISEWWNAVLIPGLIVAFNWVLDAMDKVFPGFKDFVTRVIKTFSDVIQFFKDVFSGDWSAVWQDVQNIFSDMFGPIIGIATDIWNSIVDIFRSQIDNVIGFINGLIAGACDGLNGIIDLLDKISFDWPKEMGGGHFGVSIGHVYTPQIPYLAQGAVIPANHEFMAVLGDQTSGTNIEAPLSTIQQAVATVMEDVISSNLSGYEAILATLRDILHAIYGIDIGDDIIGKAAERYEAKMAIVGG